MPQEKKKKLVALPNVLKRHSEPNAYDQAPQGTHILVNDKDLYIQKSTDETEPLWELVDTYMGQESNA